MRLSLVRPSSQTAYNGTTALRYILQYPSTSTITLIPVYTVYRTRRWVERRHASHHTRVESSHTVVCDLTEAMDERDFRPRQCCL